MGYKLPGLPIVLLGLVLAGCGAEEQAELGRGGNPTGAQGSTDRPPDADRFLLFLDRQPGLGAGEYRVVAATASAGVSASFTLTITFEDGSSRVETGSWSGSGGPDPASADNPFFTLRLPEPGGLTVELASGADSYLYLLDASGTNLLAENDNGGPGQDALILVPGSKIDSAQYATAYYKAVDPDDERTTLADWQRANGFLDAGDVDAEVLFRDVKDLGYGRWMFMRRRADGGFAFYVHNYQVDAIPGREYSRLNLDAAVNDRRRWHIGTNAIEFGPDENGRRYARFFTFAPADANGVQRRALSADLDGRGEKFMPLLCITCHGGERLPLLENGAFPDAGYIDAKLQALEPDSFEFSDAPGRGRAEQEAAIKFINQAVYESFPAPGEGLPGSHDGEFLRELLAGWYGGVDAQGRLINDRFDGEYVPLGWRPDPDDGIPPQGADELYLQVLAPSCIVCHSRRGRPLQNDVDFSTYEEFISHSAQIQELVYDRGVMPAAFLHFVDFWSGDGAKAQLLGAFLDDFRRGRDDGTTLTPGRALADPGPDRRARSPVSVSGSASAFADAYRWELVSTPAGGEAASLSGATTALVTLTAPVDGDYVLALTVSNERGASEPAEVTVSVDAAAPLYGFEQDIKPILQPNCAAECHAPDGERSNAEVDAVPVLYTDNEFLFENVRRRIDLERPEDSLLLTKPSGNHHFGGVRTGFNPDDVGDRGFYDVVLHWILQGAPENAP